MNEHTSDPRNDQNADWNARYETASQVWSGEPNGALVAEMAAVTPGRVLDVGCGEGADAVWLAQRGWRVTAIDVSSTALERAEALGREAGVEIDWQHVGLLDARIEAGTYDLVSAQYPALLRTTNNDAEHALANAVEHGGTLLVVHHADIDIEEVKSHGFDPTDYVSPANVADMLGDEWKVYFDERRPRSVTSDGGAHHTHDVVLRATRV